MGGVSEHPENEADTTPEQSPEQSPEPSPESSPESSPEPSPEPAKRQAARAALLAIGITFFGIGVVFTAVTPDNLALGITFLLVGTVLFWAGGMPKPPASGRGDRIVMPDEGGKQA